MTIRYTQEQFINAVKNSFSIASVLKNIGVRPTGGNYDVAKRNIKNLALDISHFTGQGHLRGKTHNWAKKTETKDILIDNYNGGVSTHSLKKRLIKEGLLQKKCYHCGIDEWLGQELSLELEHKNCNRNDNRIENLELLCPNCHSLTLTYRGKNTKINNDKIGSSSPLGVIVEYVKPIIPLRIITISNEELQEKLKTTSIINIARELDVNDKALRKYLAFHNITVISSKQKAMLMRKFQISKEELKKLIDTTPMTTIGKMFGVSDNAIRKRAKIMGLL